MVVRIFGNNIDNCQTAISTPKDADVDIDANDITNCVTAIELRDPPSFLASLGLQEDTPTDKVIAVLCAISDGEADERAIAEKVQKVGLSGYLSGAANLTTLVSAFYQLSNSSLIQQAIALLPK
jgi:hypothetical protein